MPTVNTPIATKSDVDELIHSYEHFLAANDPELRKARGVFYTPFPVVRYIVKAVDDILRTEFQFQKGIADDVHILDPATGVGTFFFEIIRQIHEQVEPDAWQNYVSQNLLPRLHGFEVLETPYQLAHSKLTEFLRETGCRFDKNQRFDIHLANALEPTGETADGRRQTAAEETQAMSRYSDCYGEPFVILGNPPYNVSTANQSEFAKKLIAKYKEGLENETNIQPLSDDYIKFIALGQHLLANNELGGILAYITNNSFLDGVIHRKMRQSLLETFNKIYILNLHGNTRKKETCPDGSKDENVFDIQQGTSINIFVRNPKNHPLPLHGRGIVFYADLYGTRAEKYEFLRTYPTSVIPAKAGIQTEDFNPISLDPCLRRGDEENDFVILQPQAPDYYFVPKDFSLKEEYDKGFGVNQLFVKQGTGIKFRKDNLLVKNYFTRQDVEMMLDDIAKLDDNQVLAKYNTKETRDWKLSEKRQYFLDYRVEDIKPVLYRVFDMRWTYYPMEKVSQFIVRSDARKGLMRHLLQDNLVLLTLRNQPTVQEFDRVFIAKGMIEHCVIGRGTYAFPLYCYGANGERCLNLNEEIVKNFFSHKGTKAQRDQKVSAQDIFDYIYGVLHDPQYRTTYQEFLKIDFPRVPYPKDAAEFDRYVRLGSRLRKLHLLEEIPAMQTAFPISGNNKVENVRYSPPVEGVRGGQVFINETQYFEGIPISVWNYFIGGSCPVQKYLKDRKGRVLSPEEIQYYQKIVTALDGTISILR